MLVAGEAFWPELYRPLTAEKRGERSNSEVTMRTVLMFDI